ncbi:lipase maturation factor 1 isoform X2 [Leopardus geoffroyi]|uniref:lipase maturation factor 1 isoform X2 n=1 Tax=Leopardus geoffroyi TaxID=46844 RepID=UPI001E25EF27|nr:lipase maturation factor 1 isoform X2 [Leopardus geoffroyi]
MAAPEETLRRRKAGNSGPEPETPPESGRDPTGCPARLRTGTFWLTRIVLLRALAFIYFVAFLVALHQNKQLIGDRGLLPCRAYLESVRRYFRGRGGWDAVSYAPTVLWLLDWSHMNANLDALALLGLGVSSFVLVTGCANMVLMATLWVLYMSLVNVGQIWYSFGKWKSESDAVGVWHVCGGLIKIRGDRCWRDLTCMDFHYETQPVPNPMAYLLHQSPWWVHRFETLSNHFLELVVPFFIFLGRRLCILHGALQILFQVVLVISGNLSFLNWLTMVPSIACFDDAALGFWFPSGPGGLKDQVRKMQEEAARGARPTLRYGCVVRQAVHVALGILVAWLSVPVVLNLLSPTQVMNTSFNSLRIVNTYGAFGSITKERTEVILQGTASPNASAPDAVWEDYGFKCKPGDPGRRPCLISPYHYRLDWLMWFAAFQTYEHNEWIIHLAGKLLANDREALSLLAFNPFKDRAPPRWVRGEHYRYKFSRLGGRHAAAGSWWVRKRIGPYFPPLSLRDLEGYFRSRDWPLPELE